MDVVAEIVKSLLVIIIVSSFLEIMLPDGNIKPFVRFAVGLFILIAILNPALAYMFNNNNFQISVWDDRIDERTSREIASGGQKIKEQINGSSNAVMKEKLEGQMAAVAILVPGVDDVTTQLTVGEDGTLQKVQLTVRSTGNKDGAEVEPVNVFSGSALQKSEEEQAEIRRKMQQVMSNLYGLAVQDIEIIFEGG
ncbi:MAG: stage III sporulation protein AF [Syntrophomonas sp.]|nr:stage III sporulation protein AF [Syntrophomonas sp.]